MEENKKDDKIKHKCLSCGANFSDNDKNCQYCGSLNPNYREVKDIKPSEQGDGLNTLFGGVFGSLPFGGELKRMIKQIKDEFKD